MSDPNRRLPGLADPDGWCEWWLALHPSESFAGELARFVLARGSDPLTPAGVGSGTILFTEQGREYEVRVEYVLERFAGGTVLHVVLIRSPGDALPPMTDEA